MSEKHDLLAGAWAILPDYFAAMMVALRQPAGHNAPNIILPQAQRDGLAVIAIRGPLYSAPSGIFQMLFGGMDYQTLAASLDAAAADRSISTILLNIDSPGGAVSGLVDAEAAIHRAKEAGKKVIAYSGGVMASAAYWLASAAHDIIVSKQATVGSIGVVLAITDYSKLDEKIGIEEIEIVSSQSPYKRPDPKTESGRSALQAQVDALADVFIEVVAANRRTTPENVIENYGKGGVLIGNNAKKAGLVDTVSTFVKTLEGAVMAENPITRAYLDENYPALVAEMVAEGAASVDIDAAVAAERERVSAILDAVKDPSQLPMARAAINGGVAASVAVAMIGAAVLSPSRPLAAEMAAIDNPDIGADAEEMSEEDALIQSIVNAGRHAGVKFAGRSA